MEAIRILMLLAVIVFGRTLYGITMEKSFRDMILMIVFGVYIIIAIAVLSYYM